jgi:hypothetical protein
MANEKPGQAPAQPMIRFGDSWLPTHQLWHKMEVAIMAADAIERFNVNFPHLASAATQDVVPLARRYLKGIEVHMPGQDAHPELARIAAGLLESMSPEDVTEVLRDKYATEFDLPQLIQLVGETAYCEALSREAHRFALNRVSPEQTSELWIEAGRPAPGGGLWTATKVARLLG